MSEFTPPKGELTGGGDEPWASEEDWVFVGVYGPEGQLYWFKYTGPTQPAVGDVIRAFAISDKDIPGMPREMDVQVNRVDEKDKIWARRLDDPPPVP